MLHVVLPESRAVARSPAPRLDGGRNSRSNEVEVTPAAKDHPIWRGLKAYTANDEWYYRIRFTQDDKRVTPILTTMLRKEKDKARKETLAWATLRENGGRSF